MAKQKSISWILCCPKLLLNKILYTDVPLNPWELQNEKQQQQEQQKDRKEL